MPVVGDAARRELAVADQVLAQRRELTLVAARISPPAYAKAELGERPIDPAKRKTWDRGVSQIERYRQEHGVTDPNRALGREAKRGAERARQEATWRRIREAQRALGLGQHAARARQLGRGLSIADRQQPPTYWRLKHHAGEGQPPAGVGRSAPLIRPRGAVWRVGPGAGPRVLGFGRAAAAGTIPAMAQATKLTKSEVERRRAAAERARGMLGRDPSRSFSDELIAERRAEARAEDRDEEARRRRAGS